MARNPEITCRCLECGTAFRTRRTDAYFCSPAHRKKWNNRAATRGASIYHFAMKWRAERSQDPKASNAALADLCHELSQYIQADRQDGIKRYRA